MQLTGSIGKSNNQSYLVPLEKKSGLKKASSTAWRVSLIAAATLIGGTLGVIVTALTLGSDIVILSVGAGIASLVSFIFALIITRSKKKEEKVESRPKSFEHLNEEITKAFVQANETEIGKIIELVEIANQAEENQSIPLTNEQLDLVLEVVDNTKIKISAQYQLEKLRQQLTAEMGEEKLEEIYHNPSLFPESLKNINKILSDEAIAFVVERAKNYYGNLEIVDRLREQIGQRILDRRLEKLGFKDLAERPITNEIEEAILTDTQAEVEFDKMVEKIKVSAGRDLYLDEQFIEEHFHVNQKLNELPEEERQTRRDDLQKIINQAYVTRELHNKGKITTGDATEVLLLKSLGYAQGDQSAYFDKDSLYDIVRVTIQVQLENEQCGVPLHYVKELMSLCALRTRLKAAGLTDELEIEKFKVSHKFFKKEEQELVAICEEQALKLPEDLPLSDSSLAKQFMSQIYRGEQQNAINQMLRMFNKEILLERFKNQKMSALSFKIFLNKKVALEMKEVFQEVILNHADTLALSLEQYIAFYKKWHSFMKAEMKQGFKDNNETLEEGVCKGVGDRLRLRHQKNDHFSLTAFVEEIEQGLISTDRFLQVAYSASRLFAGVNSLATPFLQKYGFDNELEIFSIEGQKGEAAANQQKIGQLLLQELIQQAATLQGSNGWSEFSLQMEKGGHATLLRLTDQEPHYVWFFDPNHGLFAFEGEGRSFEEARALCCEFIHDLIKLSYSDIVSVAANVLVTSPSN